MTLVEFYLARLDEIERVAQAASPGPWSLDADGTEVLATDGVTVAEGFALSGPQLRATVAHIALNDPAYALAEIAAKRRIVALHAVRDGTGGDWDTDPPAMCAECNHELHPCQTLRLLAAPFAAQPGYDPAWRPSST